MTDLESELSQAREELAFWIDFAKWWRANHDDAEAPRISELLANAEKRYQQAQRLQTEVLR